MTSQPPPTTMGLNGETAPSQVVPPLPMSLATVTQLTNRAGMAMMMAKKESQKPSADRSSMRMASGLPVIMRQVARR